MSKKLTLVFLTLLGLLSSCGVYKGRISNDCTLHFVDSPAGYGGHVVESCEDGRKSFLR